MSLGFRPAEVQSPAVTVSQGAPERGPDSPRHDPQPLSLARPCLFDLRKDPLLDLFLSLIHI